MKLEEGKKYRFRITKELSIEGERFLVLKGPGNRRHLVPGNLYQGYGLRAGITVVCRVDKINCNGEVFLEPPHPLFKEGEEYDFLVVGSEKRLGKGGRVYNMLIVKGRSDTEAVINSDLIEISNRKEGSLIRLRIGRISKGQIAFDKKKPDGKRVESSQELVKFKVLDIVKGVDGRPYYLVESEDGKGYSMPLVYYKEYGFEPGKVFDGRLVTYRNGSQLRVEPVNPWFRQGEFYNFRIKSISPLAARAESIIILIDDWGRTHKFVTKKRFRQDQMVRLKVDRIRRGRPHLMLL